MGQKFTLWAKGEDGDSYPLNIDSNGNLKVKIDDLGGVVVNVGASVEIANELGNPIPIVGGASRSSSSATIANGASVSSVVDLNGTSLLGFVMPAAWTTAGLSIEVSPDNVNWSATPYDSMGSVVGAVSAPVAGAAYAVDVMALLPWRYIRFKSTVNQGAARTITVVTRPLA